MSFLKSVLFGSEGSYNIFGTKVKFQNELPSHLTPPSLDGAGVISQLLDFATFSSLTHAA